MPFENERAAYAPLRRIMQSEKVKRLHDRFRYAGAEKTGGDDFPVSEIESLGGSVRQPDLILAVDGSYLSAEVKTGYPGAEIGYITVAGVLILLDKLRKISADEIINPVEYRETRKRSSIDTALPGRGVVIKDEKTPESSMRRVLFEAMTEYRVFQDSETLLETYEALMIAASDTRSTHCPCEERKQYRRGRGEYQCGDCGLSLYSVDAMRLHELFSPHESCDKMYGHVMSVLERLWLIHILRAFERRGKEWLAAIGRMAFIMDGPLAVYGTPAWLSAPIRAELARINREQKKVTNQDMMILGVEKTGAFVKHFEMLDASDNDDARRFPKNRFLLLTDEHIRNHIVPSVEGRQYGRNTYFGRKLLCKTGLGHRLVVNVACFTKEQFDLSTASPAQFPRLADSLALLNNLSSNLYPNSLSPLIAAHSEAAIPLYLGNRILEDVARKAINNG